MSKSFDSKSTEVKTPLRRAEIKGLTVLAILTLLYAVLCWPCVPRWDHWPDEPLFFGMFGMRFLWVFFTPVYMLAMPAGKARQIGLLGFSLASAFIFGCTVLDYDDPLSTHSIVLSGAKFGAEFLPVHLAVVAAEAWLMTRSAIKRFVVLGKRRFAATVLAVAAVFPFGYAVLSNAYYDWQGYSVATRLWGQGKAEIISDDWDFSRREIVDRSGQRTIVIDLHWDPGTGLEIASAAPKRFVAAYNRKLRGLLATNGVPSWSRKDSILSGAEIALAMDDPTFTQVKVFPYEIGPNTAITRGPSLKRWGKEIYDFGHEYWPNDTWIARRDDGNDHRQYRCIDRYNVYVGTPANHPNVVVVRYGESQIQVWSKDGQCIQEARVREDIGRLGDSAP